MQPTIAVQSISETQKKKIHLKLAAAIYEGGLPFRTFEVSNKPAMRDLFQSLNPSYLPPSRIDLGSHLLDEVYDQRYQEVVRRVTSASYLNFTTDEAESTNGDRIFNLSLNLLREGSFHLRSLSSGATPHTAENIAKVLIEQLNLWTNGDLSRVNSITTDTCSTMRSMHEMLRRIPGLQHVFFTLCDSHGLQLLIKDILQLPWFKELMKKISKLVSAFRKSPLQLAILREHQKKEYGRHRALILR